MPYLAVAVIFFYAPILWIHLFWQSQILLANIFGPQFVEVRFFGTKLLLDQKLYGPKIFRTQNFKLLMDPHFLDQNIFKVNLFGPKFFGLKFFLHKIFRTHIFLHKGFIYNSGQVDYLCFGPNGNFYLELECGPAQPYLFFIK